MFSEVIGHDLQIQMLKKAIASQTLAHGYLFDGKEGIGKKKVALALAKTALCGKGDEACGICPSCIQFDSENHPDFLLIEPDGLSIKDKQMEAFQSFIYIKPFESAVKVLVVDGADAMTVRAQNRILKIVEEPPGHAIIIMIAQNREALLPTVLSRLQKLSFNRLSSDSMAAYLVKAGYDKAQAALSASYADGSLGKALAFIGSEDFQLKQTDALACIRYLHEGDVLKAFERMEPYLGDKVNTISFIELVIIWYRDALLYLTHSESTLRFSLTVSDDFEVLCAQLDPQRVPVYIEVADLAIRAINANANGPLTADAMLLKLTGGHA